VRSMQPEERCGTNCSVTPHAGLVSTLSKSVGVGSRQVSVVCDLELRPGPVLCGRSRTAANETRTETGVAQPH
jgi:hypothetical protein